MHIRKNLLDLYKNCLTNSVIPLHASTWAARGLSLFKTLCNNYLTSRCNFITIINSCICKTFQIFPIKSYPKSFRITKSPSRWAIFSIFAIRPRRPILPFYLIVYVWTSFTFKFKLFEEIILIYSIFDYIFLHSIWTTFIEGAFRHPETITATTF